jgi:DNA (cytosine-5)-methyltransferase 1
VSLRVVSLFSGVGGFDLGLERAGMTTVAQVEWDPKCQQVLARHWPHVPRWGDVSDVDGADLPDCDLVAFGSPCQDLSVAGKRAGMVEGETRSGLFYEAVRIIKELQEHDRGPAWVIWENVVGALSSNRGLDFAAVVDSLGELGAVDIQWRVLDAQWFGVPQRRRRVFVVACLNPGAAGGPQVLPVGASVRRDSPTGSETGQEVAGCLGGGS